MNSIIRKNDGLANALANYRGENFLILLALAAMMVLSAKSLRAATLYWDGNTATAGVGGSGTWSSGGAMFSSSSSGGGTFQQLTSADTAVFNVASGGATGSTITLATGSSTIGTNVGSMNFNSSYSLASSGTGAFYFTNSAVVLASGVNLSLANGSADIGFYKSGSTNGILSGAGAANSTLTLAQSTGTSSSRYVRLGGFDISNNLAINVTGTGTGYLGFLEAGGTSTIRANATNNTTAILFFGANSGNTLNVNGVVSGTGQVSFSAGQNGGSGTVVLNNANTYGGDTFLNMGSSGKLQLGTDNGISTNTSLRIGTVVSTNGGAFDLKGFNQTLTGLSSGVGVGMVTNSVVGTTSALTINQSTNNTFGLSIGGNLALTKTNSGNLTLTGSNNYTGATTVSGGTLTASNNNALGASSVTVSSGGTLSILANITNTVANSGTVSVGGGGTLTAASLGSGALSLAGSVGSTAAFTSTQSGSTLSIGNLTLGGYSSYSMASDKTVSAGVITLSGTNNAITLTGASLGLGTYNLFTGSSISTASLATGGLTLGGSGVAGASVALNGGQATVGRTSYNFASTNNNLQLVIVGSGAFNLVHNGTNGTLQDGATGLFTGTDANGGASGDQTFYNADNLTLGSAGTLTVAAGGITVGRFTNNNSSGTLALSGGAINAAGLQKSGAGTMQLANNLTTTGGITNSAGTLTNSGNTTISAGGLTVSGGTASLTGSNTITAGGLNVSSGTAVLGGTTISANGVNVSGGTATLSGTSSIIGGLTVTGGTLNMNSSNSVSGSVAVSGGGILNAGHNSALGSGSVSLDNGALGSTGASSLANAVAIGAGGAIITNNSALAVGGSVTGSGNTLTKNGSGDLNLSGAVGASGAGIAMNLQQGSVTLSGSSGKFLTNSTLNGNLVVSNTAVVTRGTTIGGTGQVQIAGTSQWTNTSSQSYVTNAAVLVAGANFVSSNASSSHLHLLGGLNGTGNVTAAGAGGLYIYGSGFNGELTNNSTGEVRILNADVSGITAYRGTNAASTLTFSNSTQNRTVGGLISGGQTLNVRGTAATTFTNTQSDFTNTINVNGSLSGTTARFVGNSMGSATTTAEISLGNTNTLSLDGVTSLRNLGIKSGGGTIWVDGNSSLGNLTNNTAGGMSLTKDGAGKLTFTGLVRDDSTTNAPLLNIKAGRVTLAASSGTAQYISVAGTTTNYAGDLEISAGNQLGIQGSGTMGGGGKLILSGDDAALQTSSSSANNGAVLNIANDIVLTGGAGTKANLVATTSNTLSVNKVLGTGDLYFGIQSAGGGSGLVQLADVLSFTGNVVMNMSSDGVVRMDGANLFANGQGLVMNRTGGSGTVNLNGFSQSLGSLQSAANNATNTGIITSATAATLTLNQSTNTTYGGTIDGAVSLVKNGTGFITLANTNSMSGGVTINSGGIYLTNGSKGVGSGTITLNGGRLGALASGYVVTNSVVISSDSSFGKEDGNGNLLTLSGGIDLNGGTRVVTLDNSLTASGGISNGALVVDSSLSRNFTVSGAASYAGGTTVRGGNFRLTGSGSLNSSGAFDLAATTAAASLDISGLTGAGTTLGSLAGAANSSVVLGAKNLDVGGNNASTTYAGAVSGTGGSLSKSGTGKFTLTGSNAYTGATTVNAGTLEVASGASIESSATTVNGATLTVNGTAGDVTVNSGGTVKGSGTLSALSIASGGTLAVGNSPGTFTASSAVWQGGGTYSWELASALGNNSSFLAGQGTSWDFLNVTGVLDIAATASNKFIIDIVSLLAQSDTTFDQNSNYSFAIATAAKGITNFDGGDFSITGYLSGSNKWSLGLATNSGTSQSLVLAYNGATAIPEPSTGALLLVGLLGAIAGRRRRHNT